MVLDAYFWLYKESFHTMSSWLLATGNWHDNANDLTLYIYILRECLIFLYAK